MCLAIITFIVGFILGVVLLGIGAAQKIGKGFELKRAHNGRIEWVKKKYTI